MKFFEKNELKLLWPFYLDSLISPMLFFAPIFFVLYFSSISLTFFQIAVLFSAMTLAAIIFEIPTGAIADLYGRKVSVLLSCLLEAVGFFIVILSKNFDSILFAFAFIGFASTLASGSKEAWVIDLIKKKNKNLLNVYFSKVQSLDGFALIISGILGAFLVAKFSLAIIWPVASISFIISFAALLFAKEEYVKRKVKIKQSFKELNHQSAVSIKYSYKHHVLFYLLTASAIIVFSGNLQSVISWTPLLKELGLKDYYFGYIWSLFGLMAMIAPIVSMKLNKKGKEKKFLILYTALWVIVTSAIVFAFNLYVALLIFVLGLFFYFVQSPVQRVYFHKFIPSKLRATIGSVESMLLAIAAIPSQLLAGYLIDLIGARYTILVSGLIVIPAIVLYLKIKEKK